MNTLAFILIALAVQSWDRDRREPVFDVAPYVNVICPLISPVEINWGQHVDYMPDGKKQTCTAVRVTCNYGGDGPPVVLSFAPARDCSFLEDL